eukprot:Nk52_evm6s369 gene=Nk52_evmTU6s369
MGNTNSVESTPATLDILQGAQKDGKNVDKAIDEYLKCFNDKQFDTPESRKENYMKMVNHYYDLATDFYEYGWGQSFHFSTGLPGESFAQATVRHEHYLGLKLGLEPGMKCVDIGCGVGGPMRNIARLTGANIVGINNNEYQIKRGNMHNVNAGLDHLCSFLKSDFLHIAAPDSSFDAGFVVEASCHAPNLADVFAEVYRVLKPGAYFCSYEWLMTDKYDPENPEHRRIKHGIEEGDSLPDLVTKEVCFKALQDVGFEIVEYEDLAQKPEHTIKWYQPLAGGMSLDGFRHTWLGRKVTHFFVSSIETIGLAPTGSTKVSSMLMNAADALVAGGQQEIFTPCFFYKVRKPLNAK